MRFVTWSRIVGLLLMAACVGATNWMLTDSTFSVDAPRITGDLRITSQDELLGRAALPFPANVFRLSANDIRSELVAQPAVRDASVMTGLPNNLQIAVTERAPVFAINRQDYTVVVDGSGKILAAVDPSVPAALGIPVIDDQSSAPPELSQVGATLDPIELAAVLQLGAVTPALVDSQATSLQLSMRDDDGFVVTAQPQGWEAVFGQYTPNLRPTDIIARQVQCLRALVDSSESDLQTVYLSPLDERCGTYLPVATPYVPTPAPSKSH